MKLSAVILVTAVVLLSLTCKADYDITEVASPEHLETDHPHEHDEYELEDAEHGESDHEHEAESVETGSVHDESLEHDVSDISGSDRHVHGAGERNHGTGWFFNQPWAASFIWGKMVRDSVILIILAAAIFITSGYRRKRK